MPANWHHWLVLHALGMSNASVRLVCVVSLIPARCGSGVPFCPLASLRPTFQHPTLPLCCQSHIRMGCHAKALSRVRPEPNSGDMPGGTLSCSLAPPPGWWLRRPKITCHKQSKQARRSGHDAILRRLALLSDCTHRALACSRLFTHQLCWVLPSFARLS